MFDMYISGFMCCCCVKAGEYITYDSPIYREERLNFRVKKHEGTSDQASNTSESSLGGEQELVHGFCIGHPVKQTSVLSANDGG